MEFNFKNTAALAAVIDFVTNFRILTNTLVGCQESTEQTLEFITSNEPLLMQLLEITDKDLEVAYTEPDRYYTGDENNHTGDIVNVFGWYGEQVWDKVMLAHKLQSGEWKVKRIRKSS
jgi:hypothetical protein